MRPYHPYVDIYPRHWYNADPRVDTWQAEDIALNTALGFTKSFSHDQWLYPTDYENPKVIGGKGNEALTKKKGQNDILRW